MANPKIYQIKVTLMHSKPPIWRRIQVPGATGLDRLHDVLQIAMGWWNEHPHEFLVGDESYGPSDPDFPSDFEDEDGVRLDDVATEGATFHYEYDFGDSWAHELQVEKVFAPEPGAHYPRCLAGERACPPEDCGGIPGYRHLLAVQADPKHKEHENILEWLGDKKLDPEAFDLEAVNEKLRKLRKAW